MHLRSSVKAQEKVLKPYLQGTKCVHCGSSAVWRTGRGYVKCKRCKRQKGGKILKHELMSITGFYKQREATSLARKLRVNYRTVQRVYRKLREEMYQVSELEGKKMFGQIGVPDACLIRRRKGKRCSVPRRRSLTVAILERRGTIYTKASYSVGPTRLLAIVRRHCRTSEVCWTETCYGRIVIALFRTQQNGWRTIREWHWEKKATPPSGGIEAFLAFVEKEFRTHRSAWSKDFPLFFKEMEYRFNHRGEDLLEGLIKLYFRGIPA